MARTSRPFKQRLMLFSACGLVASLVPAASGLAQSAPAAQSGPGVQVAQATTAAPTIDKGSSENIIVRAQRQILKEKNSPSAVTELGTKQIASTGVGGSTVSLLRQAPSVYVYQQGLGDNAPEITVRGLRGLEIATTLDGVPTQDLEAPGASYLANNIGGVVTLSQIAGVSIYPGVAYPDKNTFGTIGGTIAYNTKRASDDYYLDVIGAVGSFGTYKEGFELNSGAIDTPLGTGDNAMKVLLNYNNLQTQGFIDGTPNRENEMEFAFDKPYNDGLSKFQATAIYNTAAGLIQNEPVPVPYLQKYGMFSNYPTNLDFGAERNDYLTMILKDQTYVNDYLTVELTGFYLHNDQQTETYADINAVTPSTTVGPLTVALPNGSLVQPFINNFAGFGYPSYLFGPPTPPPLGLFGGGTGGYFYGTGHHYNPGALYPIGSKYCPTAYANNVWGGSPPCGLNDQVSGGSSDTFGIQPRATIIVPEVFGIANTIKIGSLIAKETSPTGYEYLGGGPQTAQIQQNEFGDRVGGTEREIYQAFIQDKIDFLDDTLHITPGLTIEGTHSSFKSDDAFGSHLAGAYGPQGYFVGKGNNIDQYGYYKSTKWDRDYLPFANISYDFDKILPPLKGTQVYASYGTSALFAPVGDFGPNTAGPPPYASIVHLYEAGVKYNTANVLVSFDYFYQKVDRDFGYFSFQSGPQDGLSVYSGFGQRETKGVEASVVWQVTPDIQLFANGSHLLAKYLTTGFALDTVAEDQYGTVFKGTPETGIPDWLSTFGVDYGNKSLLRDGDAMHVRFSGQYTGKQFTTYDLGGSDYLNVPNYPGLSPLDFSGCPGVSASVKGAGGCLAYTRYNQVTGATTYDPNGGIAPFVIFNLDWSYTVPTPMLPILKKVTFDLNIQNLFNQSYFQYFYKQIPPANCGTFTSGPFYNPVTKVGYAKNNYSCTPQFEDGIPGQPFSAFFTVTARF